MLEQNQYDETLAKVRHFIASKRYEDGEKLLQASLDQGAPAALIHNLLGLIYQQQSRFAEALAAFQTAWQKNPSYLEPALNLIACLCDLGCYEQAQRLAESLYTKPDCAQPAENPFLRKKLARLHAQTGGMYQQLGFYEEALKEYFKALSWYEPQPEVRMAIAKAYLQQGKLAQAKEQLETLLSLNPRAHMAYLYLGLVHFKGGEKNMAKQIWEKAQQCAPQNPLVRAYHKIAENWPIDPPTLSSL